MQVSSIKESAKVQRGPPIFGCLHYFFMYLQLPSIAGGRLVNRQPEDAPCRGDKETAFIKPKTTTTTTTTTSSVAFSLQAIYTD
jgi:hypothetical protein